MKENKEKKEWEIVMKKYLKVNNHTESSHNYTSTMSQHIITQLHNPES